MEIIGARTLDILMQVEQMDAFEKFARDYGQKHYSNEYALLTDDHREQLFRVMWEAGRIAGLEEALREPSARPKRGSDEKP